MVARLGKIVGITSFFAFLLWQGVKNIGIARFFENVLREETFFWFL